MATQEKTEDLATENVLRPFARMTARVVPREELLKLGIADEGFKAGFLTTSEPEPEVG